MWREIQKMEAKRVSATLFSGKLVTSLGILVLIPFSVLAVAPYSPPCKYRISEKEKAEKKLEACVETISESIPLPPSDSTYLSKYPCGTEFYIFLQKEQKLKLCRSKLPSALKGK